MTEEPNQILTFLLDENVDKQVLAYLKAEGYEGEHVVDVLGPGVDDIETILPYANTNNHKIISKDTDFVRIDSSEHDGVFILGNHKLTAYQIATGVLSALQTLPDATYTKDIIYVDSWV